MRILCGMLILLLAGGCGGGGGGGTPTQPDVGQVAGSILDDDNAGVQGVPIELRRTGSTTRNTTTAGNGGFTFANVAVGTWTVVASPISGYEPDGVLTASVEVVANGSATVPPMRLRRVTVGGPVVVSMVNSAFSPVSQPVAVGGTVRWVNADNLEHNTTSATGVWASPTLGSGQSFEHTFNQAGTFNYTCTLHPGMAGSIVVQ